MVGNTILAPNFVEYTGPTIFLAGPILGAVNWQEQAIGNIRQNMQDVIIASPRGDYSIGEFNHERQVGWETYHLAKAAEYGVIIFWLAKENEHKCERAYAQTTRFELAEMLMTHKYRHEVNLAIGVEPGFSGDMYLRRRIVELCPDLTVLSTLEETCSRAIRYLNP
jgi:hypothetical protein